MSKLEKFIVKHYSSDKYPSIKGNGFDGTLIGDDREDAEEFIGFVNDLIDTIKIIDGAMGWDGAIVAAFEVRRAKTAAIPKLSIQNPDFLDNLKRQMFPCYGNITAQTSENCTYCMLKDLCLEESTK